ncbi:winged helix-turn-helix domain-containing protein [Geovibrio ferrireducens]|uniref:winged helix-turn-helix domain-containing protein n=1 Tax=Geovibrio ferrireducens TaxID=46201 RepID=UPI00224672A5|nr:hypothetical protein [Geovibrio ferrireducens]
MGIGDSVRKYLLKTLGWNFQGFQKESFGSLPMYLSSRYKYFSTYLFEQRLIFMQCDDYELTPAQIYKDYNKVQNILNQPLVYVDEVMTSYDRERLIKYGVQFVVPNKQIFLPDLRIDLREHFSKRKNKAEYFSPSAQMVLLSVLWRTFDVTFSIGALVDRFGISTSNAQRLIDDLEELGLAESHKEGRERIARFVFSGKELWDNSVKYLKSPVKKRLFIKDFNSPVVVGFIAGLTALSECSMLSTPRRPSFAVSQKTWDEHSNIYQLAKYADEAALEVEIWTYPPEKVLDYKSETEHPFSFGNAAVDKLSMYLSLRNDYDERVQGELADVLEKMQW